MAGARGLMANTRSPSRSASGNSVTTHLPEAREVREEARKEAPVQRRTSENHSELESLQSGSSENSVLERTNLLGSREEIERTPDVPEDGSKTFCKLQRRGPQSRRLHYLWCSGGLALAITLLLASFILLRSSVVESAFQVPFLFSWRDNPWTGGRGLCNASALPFVPGPIRAWRLSPAWRRVCEAKNHENSLPFERNWCWIGIKDKCHANLKAHHSWERLQELASQDGIAPPVADATFQPLENPGVCDRPWFGKARHFRADENETARRWMEENVAVYVLNLPGDNARWAMISQRLNSLEIWATRISGVDMRVSGALAEAKRMGWVPEVFNFSRVQSVAYKPEHNMGSILGTLGCASAHFKVQHRVLVDNSPLGLVLEDDSWPEDDFVQRLWSIVNEELPCDWEVLALMSRCPYGRCVSQHLARVQPDGNEPAWRCRHGVNWGMHGILYRTSALPRVQKLWKLTVFDEERPHCLDVDVALASISDKVAFYAVPAVQEPGFLRETNQESARWHINQAAETTETTTSFVYVPTIGPGEPWPGAWKYG
mmetsp:Transcript_72021/g.166813  ORF Transcript_72021/g.166813 Transcript_72021/m.166813 type:complete len:545 (-) Transcript_72021:156-1790(-)